MVDSGAAVTVISFGLYQAMPETSRPKLQPLAENIQLQAADDGRLHVHGLIEILVNIEDETFKWDAYVADISDDGLLGFDFLHHFNCLLEARRGLRINDRLFAIECESKVGLNVVYVKRDTVVPANSEFIVPGETNQFELENDTPYVIVEPISEGKLPVHVAHCVVDINRTDIDIPVRVANTKDEDVHLHAGTRIACIQTVNIVTDIDDFEKTTEKSSSRLRSVQIQADHDICSWPDGLRELYERSCADLSRGERDRVAALLNKHVSTFAMSSTDHGRTSIVQHKIETGDAIPIKQRPRRPPRAFEGEEEKIIASQLEAGIIRESTSPWSSPLVYVRKRDGSTRQCVDYRKLNEVTKKDAYPLPRIEDCLDCLGGANIFSTLDLQSGYWQIEIKEDDRPKTAFSTRTGHYEYVTMPFGLCNAPSTFERAMELIMKGLQWKTLILYLDDIIVMGSSFDEHLDRLDEVLTRLTDAGLKLKPSKCHLFRSEVAYLGHVVSESGIKPDPEKVRRVQEWPTPTSITDVRSFLGLCSYYRRFIRGFSTIAAPLNKLLEKSSRFKWDEECQASFDTLKQTLVSDHVMAYPNNDGIFILDTDASATGIGAVLSQLQWDETSQKEVERPVAFASRSLTRTQRRYCTTRRELLAVVCFVRHFRHFLLGRKFLIRTDHSSLRWIMSFREPTDQMARWLEILSQFEFVIEHREGKKHNNADSLSRTPCDPDTCECYNESKIMEELPCGGCSTCQRRHREWSDFFSEDDIVPLSAKAVKQAGPEISTNKDKYLFCDRIKAFADASLYFVSVLTIFFIAFFSWSISSTRRNIVFGCMCLITGLVFVSNGVKDALQFVKLRLRPTSNVVSSVNVKRASMTRTKARRGRDNAVDVAKNDTPPCVSDTDAIAGGLSGQQGILLGNIDRAELITMQKEDPDIGIVYGWLIASPDRPDRSRVHNKSPTVRNLWLHWNQLHIVDGLLYKRNHTNSKLTTGLQLVVPENLRDRVLKACHASVLSGHLGMKKTLSKLQRSFYWLNMRETVRVFLSNCITCGARKRPTSKPRAPLGEYSSGSPMDRVAMDIMGPFPTSSTGNRYVLVIGDTFTKWVEAYAIPDQTASTIADVVVKEFIARFGTPLEIHTDQGKNFESALFQDICRLLEITKTRTTPYHPASNGMIERFNRTLVDMISSFVDKKQQDWDKNLSLLTSAYRSTIHEATGFSPNFLMLGREVRTPIEVSLGIDRPDDDHDHTSPHDHAVDIVATMTEASRIAREHISDAQERQKKNYDARLSINNFRAGDLVYYLDSTKRKGLSPKLNPHKWIGPCVIITRLSDLVFELRSKQTGKTKVLHHDRLKPYTSAEVPSWVKNLSQKLKEGGDPHKRQAGTQTRLKDTIPQGPPRRSTRPSKLPQRFGY